MENKDEFIEFVNALKDAKTEAQLDDLALKMSLDPELRKRCDAYGNNLERILNRMQEKSKRRRDESPGRKAAKECYCGTDRLPQRTCTGCAKLFCKHCIYITEDPLVETIISCKHCMLRDPEPVATGYKKPAGCGRIYFETAMDAYVKQPAYSIRPDEE